MVVSPLQSSYTISVLQNALSLMCAGLLKQMSSFAGGLPRQKIRRLFPTGVFALNTHMRGELRTTERALEPTQDLFLDHNQLIRNELMLIKWLFVPLK